MRCRRSHTVVAVAALSLLAAGCGGGGSPSAGVAGLGTATTTAAAGAATGGSSPGASLAEYAGCMRSHGIRSFPGSSFFGSSPDIKAAKSRIAQVSQSEAALPTFQAAQRACAKYGPPTASPPHVSAEEMQKLLAVSRCMRTHGIPNFPDPDPTTGELTTPPRLDKTSPQAVAAIRACSSLGRAAGLGPPTTTP
jgi:hypothetical protein